MTSFKADQTRQDDAVRPKSVFHKSRRHAALLWLTVSLVTELGSFPDPIENRPLEHEQLQQLFEKILFMAYRGLKDCSAFKT